MKKGDVVRWEEVIEKGEHLLGNVDKPEDFTKYPKELPLPYDIIPDPLNEGKWKAVTKEAYTIPRTGTINWVDEDELSITVDPNPKAPYNRRIEVLNRTDVKFEVISKGPEQMKEDLANLSDEELRKRIEQIRSERETITPRKSKKEKTPSDNSPLAQALSKLTPEQMARLREKLGKK